MESGDKTLREMLDVYRRMKLCLKEIAETIEAMDAPSDEIRRLGETAREGLAQAD